ncbi:PAS domain S-box protein [Spirulina sp. CS-785/01]|uniref:PAS domain S-box protein n=1 Tax=Spirulina sp. CS-785/01 TaxID=3021716 RepID=UPI00232EC4B2|nr:PAS domain S-box protein [Spirulina sp. CS-785/01]MDB9314099.1 PAS domain S-box protein [Spirulina sp. CS-785/01]
MFPRATPLTPLEIQSLITRNPLIVSPDTLVSDAIARMNQVQSCRIITDSEGSQLDDFHQQARSSCVLVLKQEQVVGIFTEGDIIRLSLQQHPLQELTMASVMSHPVITLNELALTDIFAVLQRFQDHQIRHLPILNEQDHLVGLITYESLRQVALTCHLTRTYPQQTDEKENEIAQLSVKEAIALQQTKIRLRQSEQRYASLAAAAPVGIFHANAHGDCIYANERYCAILGYPLKDCMGKKWQQGLHPEDQPHVIAQWQEALRENHLFQIECRFIRPDGTVVWVYGQATTERDLEGKIIGYIGTIIDISKRKQIEADLQTLNQRYSFILDTIREGVWEWNIVTNETIVSDRYWEILGYPSHNPNRLSLQEALTFVHPEDAAHLQKVMEQHLQGNQPYNAEIRVQHQDGHYIWIHTQGQAIWDEQGNPVRMVGGIRDISDRKKAELERQQAIIQLEEINQKLQQLNQKLETQVTQRTAKLRKRETELQDFFDNAHDLIQSVSLETGRFEYVNRAWREVLGYTPEEVETLNLFDILHPDCQPYCQNIITQMQAGTLSTVEKVEITLISKTGQAIIVEGGVNCRFANNKPVATWSILRDITERQRSEAFRRAIMDLAPMGIFVYDINLGKIIFGNQAYEESLSYSLEELEALGEDLLATIYHPDYFEYLQAHDQQIKADREGKIFELDYTMIRKDGSLLLAYSREVVLNRNPDGSPAQILGVGLDITKRKQAELQLQKTNEELLRATRLKDEFLANMSHELRTPLNAILGMTETLQEQIFGSLNERQLNALNTIERSGTHLLELINEILDLAKIESGEMTIDCHPTSVVSLCQTSLTFVKRQAHKKRLKLEVNVPPYLPELLVDAKRIRQVLINLLNNAVKFTPEGGTINLDARYVPALEKPLGTKITVETPLQDYVEIVVRDTGIGIASEHLPKLFQPFVQIDSALNRKYEGTGLGLSLVKRIIDLHGGEVNVSSEVGVGSCFTITLPSPPISPASRSFVLSSAVEMPGSSPQEDKPPLILIADDNEANCSTFVSYLEAKGYRLIVASNGKEAITQAESSLPDAILMDIQMPEMDGLEAIRIIRQNPQLAQIPIMALTGLAMPEDQERCLVAGANDYLTKPVKLNELARRVQGLLLISRED